MADAASNVIRLPQRYTPPAGQPYVHKLWPRLTPGEWVIACTLAAAVVTIGLAWAIQAAAVEVWRHG